MSIMKEGTKKDLIFFGLCFLAVFAIFGRTLAGDFVFDDRGIIDHQALLGDFAKLHKVFALPYWTAEAGLYRPTTLVSYAFNFALLGGNPWGFHLINLLFYLATSWLVYRLADKLFGRKIFAYSAALFFLVLPIHTEVVANIIGRAEILALFFSLLLLGEWLKDKPILWRLALWAALALGSKETAIAIFPLAFFLSFLKEKNLSWEKLKRYFLPTVAAVGGVFVYFGARALVLGFKYFSAVETSLVENPLKFVATGPRLATALKISLMYFKKTFWPFGLCSDYSYSQIEIAKNWLNLEVLVGAAAIFSLAAIFWFCRRRQSALSLAAGWWLVGFILVSNFVFPIGTIAGERLVYFSSLGVAFFLAWLFDWLLSRCRKKVFYWLIAGGALALIIFYGVLSFWRAGDWLTEKRLFASAAKCAPNSVLSRSNLGAAYYLAGDLANAKKWLLAAQEIYPDYPKGVNNLGLVYWKEGDNQKARELFLRALSYRFPYYGAYENLALLALSEGKEEEAETWLGKFYQGNERAIRAFIESYYANSQ
ncbi:MAG: glycosyltransferase family 39 protein [Candidatus Portnoybacteria bacterium]|nr:glycosyltransferase family 39 protein [Candidatus Portnoybacteria bacterium]